MQGYISPLAIILVEPTVRVLGGMVDLRDIPEGTRWQITTRILSSLPIMYDIAFREAVGGKYDELEYGVWLELGKDAVDIAKAFHLPITTAAELAGDLRLITRIIFGAEFRYEVLEISEERATLLTKTCPFLGSAYRVRRDGQAPLPQVPRLFGRRGGDPQPEVHRTVRPLPLHGGSLLRDGSSHKGRGEEDRRGEGVIPRESRNQRPRDPEDCESSGCSEGPCPRNPSNFVLGDPKGLEFLLRRPALFIPAADPVGTPRGAAPSSRPSPLQPPT